MSQLVKLIGRIVDGELSVKEQFALRLVETLVLFVIGYGLGLLVF